MKTPEQIMHELLSIYKNDRFDLMSKYDINLAIEIFQNEIEFLNDFMSSFCEKNNCICCDSNETILNRRINDLKQAIEKGRNELK